MHYNVDTWTQISKPLNRCFLQYSVEKHFLIAYHLLLCEFSYQNNGLILLSVKSFLTKSFILPQSRMVNDYPSNTFKKKKGLVARMAHRAQSQTVPLK